MLTDLEVQVGRCMVHAVYLRGAIKIKNEALKMQSRAGYLNALRGRTNGTTWLLRAAGPLGNEVREGQGPRCTRGGGVHGENHPVKWESNQRNRDQMRERTAHRGKINLSASGK
jgi:hypothetical protein